jgi:ketosteroid isomerase-like protein
MKLCDPLDMTMTPPRRFAEAYVDIINRGAYGELGDLFAPDAIFLGPNRQEFRGRAEISNFYRQFLSEITPSIRIVSYVEQASDCVYELEAKVQGDAEYRLGAIDHATLDANGRVKRFTVWTK